MVAGPRHFALFETSIGACAIGWRPSGVCRIWLPEEDERILAARLERTFGAPAGTDLPDFIRDAISLIIALLDGGDPDLGSIPLDLGGVSPFGADVYAVARAIPKGRTLTYGEVARRIGQDGAARAVGQALGRNPFPIVVPCHRVLAAGGKSGGFSAHGGAATKMRMLEIEGAVGPQQAFLFDG